MAAWKDIVCAALNIEHNTVRWATFSLLISKGPSCLVNATPTRNTLTTPQAPELHLLLMEACDILGLKALPRVHVMQGTRPRVHLLTVPEAWASPGGSSSVRFAWRRQGLLVLTSGALKGLPPTALQAMIGAALTPLRAPGKQALGIVCITSINL